KSYPFPAHYPNQRTLIAALHSREEWLRLNVEFGRLVHLAREHHVEHWRERQRYECGDKHRPGYNNTKLAEKPAGKALQEDNGQEHHSECNGCRDNRKVDFLTAFFGCAMLLYPLLY